MEIVDPNMDESLPQPQYNPERPRAWSAFFVGDTVMVRHHAILADGEDLTENPPYHHLTASEWAERHRDYGLDINGQPIEGGG